MNKYSVSWKGKVLGSYTASEMRELVGRGKIGLLYFVEVSPGESVFVRDFLAGQAGSADGVEVSSAFPPSASETEEPPQARPGGGFLSGLGAGLRGGRNCARGGAPVRRKTGAPGVSYGGIFIYALCGGAFLSAYLYVAALLFAALTCANASRSEALKIAALATAMFLAGLAFFNAVLPTLAS